MNFEKEELKRFIISLYFPNHKKRDLNGIKLYMNKTEIRFLKFIGIPSRFYAKYYLVVSGDFGVENKKIEYKDKESVKYFVNLINAVNKNQIIKNERY